MLKMVWDDFLYSPAMLTLYWKLSPEGEGTHPTQSEALKNILALSHQDKLNFST